MSQVVAAGYLGVTAPDPAAWLRFGEDVLGVRVGGGSPGGPVLLRMDERAWRIAVHPGPGGLAYAGWEVTDAAALDRLAGRLTEAGVPVKEDRPLAARRQVRGLAVCHDPAGNQVELFYGARIPAEPFVSPAGARFVTRSDRSGEMGFGHYVISVPDAAAARRFYCDLLGLRVSDTAEVGGIESLFLHANARHHSLAFVELPDQPPAMHHFMLEVASLDTVGRALDLVLDGAAELTSTLGRHINDKMVSFYLRSPSGFEIEYGWDGLQIDDAAWTTASYVAPSTWGHRHAVKPALAGAALADTGGA